MPMMQVLNVLVIFDLFHGKGNLLILAGESVAGNQKGILMLTANMKKGVTLRDPLIWVMSMILIACTDSSTMVSNAKTENGTQTPENEMTKDSPILADDDNPTVGEKEEIPAEPANVTGIYLVKCDNPVIKGFAATVQCQVVDQNDLKPGDASSFSWDYAHPAKSQVAAKIQCSATGATAVYSFKAASAAELNQLLMQTKTVVTSKLSNYQITDAHIYSPLPADSPSPSPSSSPVAVLPLAAPVGLQASAVSATQINITWNNVGAGGYLLIARAGSAITFAPVDGTDYLAGSQGGDEIIYVGSNTSFSHAGLKTGEVYNYVLYSFNSSHQYSTAALTARSLTSECGSKGDGCYDDAVAKDVGTVVTPLGKNLEYVYANGSSGFKIWKEVGGNRILQANGLDAWAKQLNLDGKAGGTSDFIDAKLGTGNTLIKGRVCPPNVYLSDSNKFTTDNCLYYSPEYAAQTLFVSGTSQTTAGSMGLSDWSNYNGGSAMWYVGNIETCSSKHMRLPALYETTAVRGANHPYYPTSNGSPVFAEAKGVPAASGETWSASAAVGSTANYTNYWVWNGTASDYNHRGSPNYVICVLP
jgi:hypothetical protein